MFAVKVLLTYPLPPNKAHLVSKICNKHPSIKTGKLYTSWRYIKEYLYGNIHISEIHYVFPTHRGLGRALMFRAPKQASWRGRNSGSRRDSVDGRGRHQHPQSHALSTPAATLTATRPAAPELDCTVTAGAATQPRTDQRRIFHCLPRQTDANNVTPPNLKVAPRSLSHPQPFELLRSLLMKFPAPGIRLLVKCLTMWSDLYSNIPVPGIRKISFCWFVRLSDSTVVLFTHKPGSQDRFCFIIKMELNTV